MRAGRFEFVCPVLPGRRGVRHQWDGVSEWAQFDLAKPNPDTGGVLQPDPGLAYYRNLKSTSSSAEARDYWKKLVGQVELRLPDRPLVARPLRRSPAMRPSR